MDDPKSIAPWKEQELFRKWGIFRVYGRTRPGVILKN